MSTRECVTCGGVIQESTAQETGGSCIPCHSGTRLQIDEGMRHRREERERDRTDPVRIYWRELLERANESSDCLERLSEPEKHYFAVMILEQEIHRGGFDAYFFNSSGSYHRFAVRGLQAMGENEKLLLLGRAKEILLSPGEVPVDTGMRRSLLERSRPEGPEVDRQLDLLEDEYCRDLDGLSGWRQEFLYRNGILQRPGEADPPR